MWLKLPIIQQNGKFSAETAWGNVANNIACLAKNNFPLYSHHLGRRKTQTPVLAGVIGAGLSIVPILGVVYLVVLLLKKDINTTSSAVNI